MAEEKKNYESMLVKVNNTYYPMIERQLQGNGLRMDDYSKKCVLNSLAAINNVLDTSGVSWKDEALDQSNITSNLLHVASLQLNAAANPREVYFQLRNVKQKKAGPDGKPVDVWKKQIELGIEGDGNDAILSRFGRDVREVRQYWVVREEDEFEYPMYDGINIIPPKWKPKGKGKAVRVVYPIIKTSGAIEFHIAERDDVLKNLIAHVRNGLMNETFGIAQNRFKATPQQKEQIDKKKQDIVERMQELAESGGLDAVLDSPEMKKYISPAWKDEQSRESMIIRKMRNNIVKKIPKDFGSTLAELSYDETTDEGKALVQDEIVEHANSEVIDMDEDEPEQENESPQEKEPESEGEELWRVAEELDKEKPPKREPDF